MSIPENVRLREEVGTRCTAKIKREVREKCKQSRWQKLFVKENCEKKCTLTWWKQLKHRKAAKEYFERKRKSGIYTGRSHAEIKMDVMLQVRAKLRDNKSQRARRRDREREG